MPLINISCIVELFKKDSRLVKRGENAVSSGHVVQVAFDEEIQFLTGKVQASMRDKSYVVKIELSEDGMVTKATCECPAGVYLCHHMASLLIYAQKNISCTDKACAWNVKSTTKDRATIRASALFPSRPHTALKTPVTKEDVDWLGNQLQRFAFNTGFTWLLTAEPLQEVLQIPTVQDLTSCKDFMESDDKIAYLQREMKLSSMQIVNLEKLTIGQRLNSYWLMYRKGRVTASNFGAVLSACRRNKFSESLFKTLLGQYDLDGIKAVQWGLQHEGDAKKYFEQLTRLEVKETGMWFHESGLLAASPDGLVGEDCLIEVKCPFKYRNDDLRNVLKDDKYIVTVTSNGECVVNKHHQYYHQIQGQLYLSGRKSCYLLLWTLKDPILCSIKKDAEWSTNIEQLLQFARKHFLNKLLQ